MSGLLRPVILGAFGPPGLAFLRSWGMKGYRVGIVSIQPERGPKPSSRYLAGFTILSPDKLYTQDGIRIIGDFLGKFRASGLICINEKIACWLNNNRRYLPEQVEIWLPPNETIVNVLSKKRQIQVAKKVGLRVLPTWFINWERQSSEKISERDFPLCLRPSEPGSIKPSFKVHIVDSSEALAGFVKGLKEIRSPIVAQPFLNLPNMVVHGARSISGKSTGMEAFLVERKFEGVTLTIKPFTLDPDLQQKCIAFTDIMGVSGSYHFEFLLDPVSRDAFFLEINNRLGGTTAKVFACGYDEPLYALQAYGVNVQNSNKIKDITVSSKQALLKYIYYALTDRLSSLDYPDEPKAVRILKALWGLAFYRDDVWNWRDLKGSVDFYLGNLREKMGRIRAKG